MRYTRTSNCIIKTNIVKSEPVPFDPEYGITGGEDTDLFTRLMNKGGKFISSREAVVSEYIPPERTKIKWLLRKYYLTGNTATRRMIQYSSNRFLKRGELFFRAVSFIFICILLFIINFPFRKYRLRWLMKIASNLGHITAVFGHYYKGYK